MKKVILCFFIVVWMMPLFGIEERFYCGENYVFEYMEYKTTDNLRLRKELGISSEIITTIKAGSPVFIIETGKTEVIDDIESDWVKVSVQPEAVDRDGKKIKSGTEGWVFGGYLKPSANSSSLFDKWISWGADDRSSDELLTQFHLVCNTIAEEKSFSNLKLFISNSKKTGKFPFNPLIPIIEKDWKEGFDYIMTSDSFRNLATQGYSTGKYDENFLTPFSTVLENENSNSIYYAEKLLPLIDINKSSGNFGLNYGPIRRNYLCICKNEKIRQLLIDNGIRQTFEANNWKSKVVLTNNCVTLYEEPSLSASKKNYSPSSDEDFKVVEATYGTKEMWGEFEVFGNNWLQIDGWAKVTDGKETGWLAPAMWALPFGFFEP